MLDVTTNEPIVPQSPLTPDDDTTNLGLSDQVGHIETPETPEQDDQAILETLIEARLDNILPKPHQDFVAGMLLRSRIIAMAKAATHGVNFNENGQAVVVFDTDLFDLMQTYHRMCDVYSALQSALTSCKIDIETCNTNIPVIKNAITNLTPQAVLSRAATNEIEREQAALKKAQDSLDKKSKLQEAIKDKMTTLNESTLEDVFAFIKKNQIHYVSGVRKHLAANSITLENPNKTNRVSQTSADADLTEAPLALIDSAGIKVPGPLLYNAEADRLETENEFRKINRMLLISLVFVAISAMLALKNKKDDAEYLAQISAQNDAQNSVQNGRVNNNLPEITPQTTQQAEELFTQIIKNPNIERSLDSFRNLTFVLATLIADFDTTNLDPELAYQFILSKPQDLDYARHAFADIGVDFRQFDYEIAIDPLANTTTARIVSDDHNIFGLQLALNNKQDQIGVVVPDFDTLQVLPTQELLDSIKSYVLDNFNTSVEEFYADCLFDSQKLVELERLYTQIPMARLLIGIPSLHIEHILNNNNGTYNLTYSLSFTNKDVIANSHIPNYTGVRTLRSDDPNLVRILSR